MRLPQSLQRAMAAEAEAAREARAKVIILLIFTLMIVFPFEYFQRGSKASFCRIYWRVDESLLTTILEIKLMINWQVIAAEGEQKSSKALKEASDIISTSPAALQLRLTQPSFSAQEGNNRYHFHQIKTFIIFQVSPDPEWNCR